MTLGPGEVFAGYTIVRLLGSGGMGEVYLVKHPRLPRQDALKVLRGDISPDDPFRQRFIREADSVAALDHPNIVTVHDRGDTDGKLWIATQYVDGIDAAKLLGRHPAGMPIDEVAQLVAAIAQALDHAHDRGVLHRDINPANILLTEPGNGHRRILLTGFGIARPNDDNTNADTVNYLAPEQLMGEHLDGRTDQYALAATAYHLLTGTAPYANPNTTVVISRHLNTPPPRLTDTHPHLGALNAVIAKGMAKNPADRCNTCGEFAQALTDATETGHTSVTIGTSHTRTPPIAAATTADDRPEPPITVSDWGTPKPPPPTARTAPAPSPPPAMAGPSAFDPKWLGPIIFGAAALIIVVVFLAVAIGGNRDDPTPTRTAAPPTSTATPWPETVDSTRTVTKTAPPVTITQQPPPVTASSPPPAPTTTLAPKHPAAGALGDWCSDKNGIGTGPGGTLYYCERLEYTDGYQWALTPGVIPNPTVTPYTPPPPSDINPSGPTPMDPCTVPGAIVPGQLGLTECKWLDLGPFTGYFWGLVPR